MEGVVKDGLLMGVSQLVMYIDTLIKKFSSCGGICIVCSITKRHLKFLIACTVCAQLQRGIVSDSLYCVFNYREASFLTACNAL